MTLTQNLFENIEAKGENAGNKLFFSFSHHFPQCQRQKSLFYQLNFDVCQSFEFGQG